MEPTGDFWGGVGASVAASPWWAVVGGLLVLCVAVIAAKYVYPGHKEIKMRELGIREREAENDRDRICANAALAEDMRGLRESNDNLATQTAAMTARLNESAARSQEMGGDVRYVKEAADDLMQTAETTARKVDDIHRAIVRRKDNDI